MPLRSRVGAMRESLALRRNTETTSTGTGFRTPSWATYATVAGEEVEPDEGTEQWKQGAVVGVLGPRFRIRARDDVRAKDQVLWRGLTLEILAPPKRIVHVGARFLLLECGYTQ